MLGLNARLQAAAVRGALRYRLGGFKRFAHGALTHISRHAACFLAEAQAGRRRNRTNFRRNFEPTTAQNYYVAFRHRTRKVSSAHVSNTRECCGYETHSRATPRSQLEKKRAQTNPALFSRRFSDCSWRERRDNQNTKRLKPPSGSGVARGGLFTLGHGDWGQPISPSPTNTFCDPSQR